MTFLDAFHLPDGLPTSHSGFFAQKPGGQMSLRPRGPSSLQSGCRPPPSAGGAGHTPGRGTEEEPTVALFAPPHPPPPNEGSRAHLLGSPNIAGCPPRSCLLPDWPRLKGTDTGSYLRAAAVAGPPGWARLSDCGRPLLPDLLKLVQFFNWGPISFTNGGPVVPGHICSGPAHWLGPIVLPPNPSGPIVLIPSGCCVPLIYPGGRPAGSWPHRHSWRRCLRPGTS